MNDDELIAAVAGGNDSALRELFIRHAPWLAARLRATLPAADVEDVLQETFLGVWRGASGYRPAASSPGLGQAAGSADSPVPASPPVCHGSAGGWLWGIARRQAALWLRRSGRPQLPVPGPAADGQHADPADTAVLRSELADAVSALGPKGGPRREVWRLLYVEDRSVAEVAAMTGVPAGTVKSRAHKARAVMRAALRNHDPARKGDGQ